MRKITTMAKKSKSGPKTWLTVKVPKSSMTEDYTLDFEHMESPFEESLWDPGDVKDSRGSRGDAKHFGGKKSRQKGTQKTVGKEVMDI